MECSAGREIFVRRVPPNADAGDVRAVMERFGAVAEELVARAAVVQRDRLELEDGVDDGVVAARVARGEGGGEHVVGRARLRDRALLVVAGVVRFRVSVLSSPYSSP